MLANPIRRAAIELHLTAGALPVKALHGDTDEDNSDE